MKACVVAIVKDEGKDILEWLLYYIAIGFSSIIIYDNNSTDDTARVVKNVGQSLDVRLVDWPEHPGQVQAYNHAISSYGTEFEFMFMVDADEFLVLSKGDTLEKYLKRIKPYPAVAIHWLNFGSSNHQERPAGLIIENYLWRSKKLNAHVKTIFQPAMLMTQSRFVNPHFLSDVPYVWSDGSSVDWQKHKIGGKAHSPTATHVAFIAHYITKSAEDFRNKIARGVATSKVTRSWALEDVDCNEIQDRRALDWNSDAIAQVRKRMSFFRKT